MPSRRAVPLLFHFDPRVVEKLEARRQDEGWADLETLVRTLCVRYAYRLNASGSKQPSPERLRNTLSAAQVKAWSKWSLEERMRRTEHLRRARWSPETRAALAEKQRLIPPYPVFLNHWGDGTGTRRRGARVHRRLGKRLDNWSDRRRRKERARSAEAIREAMAAAHVPGWPLGEDGE